MTEQCDGLQWIDSSNTVVNENTIKFKVGVTGLQSTQNAQFSIDNGATWVNGTKNTSGAIESTFLFDGVYNNRYQVFAVKEGCDKISSNVLTGSVMQTKEIGSSFDCTKFTWGENCNDGGAGDRWYYVSTINYGDKTVQFSLDNGATWSAENNGRGKFKFNTSIGYHPVKAKVGDCVIEGSVTGGTTKTCVPCTDIMPDWGTS